MKTNLKQKIRKVAVKLAVPTLITGILGATAYFSRPEYREFVPVTPQGNEGYFLNTNKGKTEVQGGCGIGSFRYAYVVDEDGDLRPDYTESAVVANIRLAGKFQKKPSKKEREIFEQVIKLSKRFGNRNSLDN